ncbi:MAG: glycosyltransferase family 4 protein [Lachnospiraceae bacterium]|nr:glycosyltransferase family 4 protein [Lachnospiraceae bacterium]
MKVFIVGDYLTGTGPANVTEKYIEYGGKNVIYQSFKSKPLRAVELFFKIPACRVVLCSGYSKQNILAIKLGHFFKKKCAYLMHGCVEHENNINGVPDPAMSKVERETLRLCDRIYAVSDRFKEWLIENYPDHKEKIFAMPNGIDLYPIKNPVDNKERDYASILSVGGGMPRKRIVNICKAIERLKREEEFKDLTLKVIGAEGLDSQAINSYRFVKNYGLVDKNRAEEIMRSSGLFIQNSCFETFGLAPLEALKNGCDILLSKEVGAIGVFKDFSEKYTINDCEDIDELSLKIKNMIKGKEHNNELLLSEINKGSLSWKSRSRELLKSLSELT